MQSLPVARASLEYLGLAEHVWQSPSVYCAVQCVVLNNNNK